VPPAQTREATEVSVGGDPFTGRLDGKGGEVGVRLEVSLGRGFSEATNFVKFFARHAGT